MAIDLLIVILRENGVMSEASLPAEIFRMAKFDRDEAVGSLISIYTFDEFSL